MPALVPIRPEKLLEHAQELVDHHVGAGRPRAVFLRRAISAAVYALFHDVGLRVAKQLLPNGADQDLYRLCRSVNHARLKEVCAWITGQGGEGKKQSQLIVQQVRTDPGLRAAADVVVRLQEARHQADYDHLAAVDKATALSYVLQAQRAIDDLHARVGQPQYEAFVALVALHTQLR